MAAAVLIPPLGAGPGRWRPGRVVGLHTGNPDAWKIKAQASADETVGNHRYRSGHQTPPTMG